MWDKIVEKAINAEVKTSLQLLSKTKEINYRYPKGYQPSAKKNKDNASQKHCNKASNKDKDKAKFHNFSFVNQSQTQASKKDKRGCHRSYPTTRVNAIKVAKKDKYKTNYVKYHTYKQNSHYVKKCLEKLKILWRFW